MATKSSTKTAAKSAPKRKTAAAAKPTAKAAPKTTRKPAAKPAAKTTAAKPSLSVVKEAQPFAMGKELKKPELLDLVLKRTDVKKKFAKPVVEAMLEVLGEVIAEERSLNLQPMGRVMPQRSKDVGKNRVIIARIRQSKEKTKSKAAEKAGGATPESLVNPPVAKPAE